MDLLPQNGATIAIVWHWSLQWCQSQWRHGDKGKGITPPYYVQYPLIRSDRLPQWQKMSQAAPHRVGVHAGDTLQYLQPRKALVCEG